MDIREASLLYVAEVHFSIHPDVEKTSGVKKYYFVFLLVIRSCGVKSGRMMKHLLFHCWVTLSYQLTQMSAVTDCNLLFY